MKPIRFSRHALGYCGRRGFSTGEVEKAIQTGKWQAADFGRFECRVEFPFHAEWNGTYYATKQVRPVFVDEPDAIVVITVYVFYY